jgi:hypothetical protein
VKRDAETACRRITWSIRPRHRLLDVTSIPVSTVSSICLECDLVYLEESLMQQQASAIRAAIDIENNTDEQSDRMTYEDLSR